MLLSALPQPSARLHARAPLSSHNPQGRICCASIPIGRFPSGRNRDVLSLRWFFIFCPNCRQGLYPLDRLMSSRTTFSKSAPRSALHGRKFCSRVPQRQSRLLTFFRDYFFLVLGGVCFCGNAFHRKDISAFRRQLVSSQIRSLVRLVSNARRLPVLASLVP